MPYEPGDECPFPKPFPVGFRECPAYEPRLIFPTDVSNRPLNPVWTCAHLGVASRTRGGWYASCGLGNAAGRARWLDDRGELGATMAQLRADSAGWSAPLIRRLMVAREHYPLAEDAEAMAIRDALLAKFDVALLRHEARLTAAAADPAELRDAFRQVIDGFIHGANAEPLASEEMVAGFGPAARLLFKPEREANLNLA
jgi:hypothetical protein